MIKFKVNKRDFRRAQKTLDEVVEQVQRRAMKDALMKAAQPGLKAARAKVPKLHGHLRKSLVKKGKTMGRGTAFVVVGPNRKYKATVNGKEIWPVKYAHLVEFGTSDTRPQPFMRPSFNSSTGDAKRIYKESIGIALMRQAKRADKRMRK